MKELIKVRTNNKGKQLVYIAALFDGEAPYDGPEEEV